jgi:hypothetical protein
VTLPPGNPMTTVLVTLLAFEAVVFGLAIPGMIMVSEVPVVAFTAGGAAMVVALLACGLLRRGRPGTRWAGSQAIGVALGLLTPTSTSSVSCLALLWVVTFVLGRRLSPKATV